MDFLLNMMPPELHALPVLVAGFVALLGLVLWSAGIKVARPMTAALLGATLAGLGMWILPAFTGLGVLPCAAIGLAVGIAVGAFAFRALQGVILATCLGLIAGGAFYHWQINHWAKTPTNAPTPHVAPIEAGAGWPAAARTIVQTATAHWMAIPTTLRQSMIVIAMGVAILALAIAWAVPRHTTWLTTAAGGTALLGVGGLTLLKISGLPYERMMPVSQAAQLGTVLVMVLAGMLIQHVFFWPGKRQQEERAKDAAA